MEGTKEEKDERIKKKIERKNWKTQEGKMNKYERTEGKKGRTRYGQGKKEERKEGQTKTNP